MASTRRPLVALNLPRTVQGVIRYARAVVAAMRDNPLFPSPPISLDVFAAEIEALFEADVALLTTRGTADRNEKYAIVRAHLGHLQAYVQAVADANPAEASSIIQKAGMHEKKVGSRGKNALEATRGPVPGSAQLVAKAAARRASYEWQYSKDGNTWVDVLPTLGATTDITGLEPATTYFFRFRSTTTAGTSDWSQVVSLIVG